MPAYKPKCVVKEPKGEPNTATVTFNNLTHGEVLAMKHALDDYAKRSPVAYDVRSYLFYALRGLGWFRDLNEPGPEDAHA